MLCLAIDKSSPFFASGIPIPRRTRNSHRNNPAGVALLHLMRAV
jgi:hypothetical protein